MGAGLRTGDHDMNDATPVFATPLSDLLLHIWFDGFASGLSSGLGVFLPGEAADAKADEMVGEAIQSQRFCAEIRASIQQRTQELLLRTVPSTPIATGEAAVQLKDRLAVAGLPVTVSADIRPGHVDPTTEARFANADRAAAYAHALAAAGDHSAVWIDDRDGRHRVDHPAA